MRRPNSIIHRWAVAVVLLAMVRAPSVWADEQGSSSIDGAFAHLYNFDFPGVQRTLDAYAIHNSNDPLLYGVRAASALFQELDRLKILESEFFDNDKKFVDKKKVRPDPELRRKFFEAVGQAQTRARAVLQVDPLNTDALFTMSLAAGLSADYNSLVEKKQWGSLTYVKEANEYAGKLLQVHPGFGDAYLTSGVSEYLLGSLPFFLRWLVHIDGVEGNKSQAEAKLQRVIRSGRYLRPFAKILLSIYFLREKQPERSQKLLAELAHDYPGNPLYRKELEKVASLVHNPAP